MCLKLGSLLVFAKGSSCVLVHTISTQATVHNSASAFTSQLHPTPMLSRSARGKSLAPSQAFPEQKPRNTHTHARGLLDGRKYVRAFPNSHGDFILKLFLLSFLFLSIVYGKCYPLPQEATILNHCCCLILPTLWRKKLLTLGKL